MATGKNLHTGHIASPVPSYYNKRMLCTHEAALRFNQPGDYSGMLHSQDHKDKTRISLRHQETSQWPVMALLQ